MDMITTMIMTTITIMTMIITPTARTGRWITAAGLRALPSRA
ncbi:hypothetical protein FBZ88_101500 [Nitrospirillum bahiense]|uniref:Uncharacterized protein n=1 Tax=Nitrospirillum amazonense TaxID=28077 RepID=A0A560GDY8_9PROT|nr:hypothetical protein FBZ88_101500 [Nitrospirillum amazonense]